MNFNNKTNYEIEFLATLVVHMGDKLFSEIEIEINKRLNNLAEKNKELLESKDSIKQIKEKLDVTIDNAQSLAQPLAVAIEKHIWNKIDDLQSQRKSKNYR